MPNKKGLGKGFDALIPQNFDTSLLAEESERIRKVKISDIVANPDQPRKHFDDTELAGLATSLKEFGVLQPLIVTENGEGSYLIIAGERRWRAADLAGIKVVPTIIRTSKELERLEMALVENMQRVDLSPLEQAVSIESMREQFSMDYEAIAQRLGKAKTTIQNTARMLQLSDAAKDALRRKAITEGHARAILALKEAELQTTLLDLIVKNGWSVRQAERYVVAHKRGAKNSASAQRKVATTTPQTERLGKVLKTTVTVRRMAKGGKLEIGFKNENDLRRLMARLARK